ncbi:MAG TPA: GNAT family N-acetyltransferase [Flavisolibacter sp.]|nr:GNAT family N-acetyltransferase [Flavisolibacter sp.]
MKRILETERLLLREFTLEDTAFIIELLNSPGWIQYIGDRNIKTKDKALAYLENGPLKSYQDNGFGLYMVEKKDDNTPIGMCGIIKRETLSNPDIGFAFLPEYNGKGYALEMAAATLAFAKQTLKLPVISAITLAGNARSIRLLEKIGMQFSQTVVFPGSEEELLLYNG